MPALPLDHASTAGLTDLTSRGRVDVDSPVAFRPDIEGLRGVAVLSILAVHTFPDWIRGGLIGIDIFFVLSGYLISTVVFEALESGRFRYGDFFVRRVRRIVPALCVVLLSVLALALLFMFPAEVRLVARGVAAAAVFMSYVVTWHDAANATGVAGMAANPLLHLWTLSVEAWFYAAWPLAAIVLYRGRRLATWTIAAAATLLFVVAVVVASDRSAAAFLLLPMRAGELLAGALLASLTLSGGVGLASRIEERLGPASPWRGRVASLLAWGGSAFLTVAVGLAEVADRGPVAWSLLPTAGTVLLLAAGPSAVPNRRLLSQSVLRFYGAISYPLYLWHWPLFAFPLILGIPLTSEVRVMILIASVALAALTYELVERPVRSARPRLRAALGWLALLVIVGLGAVAAVRWGDHLGALAPDCIDQGDDSGPCSWRTRELPSR